MTTADIAPGLKYENPRVRSTALERGTFLTTDVAAMRRFFEEVLDLETVKFAPGKLFVRERGHRPGELKFGQPYLVLEVHEVPVIENPQALLNHWGVFVASQSAVDIAYMKLVEHQREYQIKAIQRPRAAHGAYSFYFCDFDDNWWEVEHRIPRRNYTSLRTIGDVV